MRETGVICCCCCCCSLARSLVAAAFFVLRSFCRTRGKICQHYGTPNIAALRTHYVHKFDRKCDSVLETEMKEEKNHFFLPSNSNRK